LSPTVCLASPAARTWNPSIPPLDWYRIFQILESDILHNFTLRSKFVRQAHLASLQMGHHS